MKKIILLITITAVLFSTISCGSIYSDHALNDASSATPTGDNTSNTGALNGEIEHPSHMELAEVRLDGYDEYLSGLESLDLPNNFVYYDSICQFGVFDAFVVGLGDYSKYIYFLIDDSGNELTLYIEEHSDETISSENIVMNISSNDMRFLDTKSQKNSAYFQGDLKYCYVYGNLLSVEWVQNGLKFTLYADYLHQYPNIDTTLTGKLLNKGLASTAYETYIAPITEAKK